VLGACPTAQPWQISMPSFRNTKSPKTASTELTTSTGQADNVMSSSRILEKQKKQWLWTDKGWEVVIWSCFIRVRGNLICFWNKILEISCKIY